jgi:glutamine cyclotransferase
VFWYEKQVRQRMRKRHLAGIGIGAVALVLSSIFLVAVENWPMKDTIQHYGYTVVNAYPHDAEAFTEGLVFTKGFLYESTGLYGNSTLRRVELATGRILQLHALDARFFGEGLTISGNRLIQLTWQSQTGFEYDKDTFELLREFSYPTEGWGITYDGTRLIMSDGTASLYFLDPENFQKIGQVQVHDAGSVTNLNELEYIRGEVYANIWKEDKIAIINPQTGLVRAWVNLSGIYNSDQDPDKVLNGIAYDSEEDRLFVTGKMWPTLFEIKLVPSS